MNLIRFSMLMLAGSAASAWFVIPAETPRPVSTELSSRIELPPVNVRYSDDTGQVPDFQRHVGPLLGQLGCNGRSCHGSFQGQGDFRLTLFGYDFDSDHQSLTAEGSYRVDREDPDASLILTKPTDAEGHGGGLRFQEDSWQYRLIRNWIAGGAKNFDSQQTLLSLTVTPSEIVTRPQQVDQLQVVAHWNDGVKEDVTPLVRFRSNDPAIAAVDSRGAVTGLAKGDTHVIVFYDNQVLSVPVISPVAGAGPIGSLTF